MLEVLKRKRYDEAAASDSSTMTLPNSLVGANQSKKQSFNHFQHILDRFAMIFFSEMKKFFQIIIFYFGLKIWLIFFKFFVSK
jgi:hypothetical protein